MKNFKEWKQEREPSANGLMSGSNLTSTGVHDDDNFKKLIFKLSSRLGEKTNRYIPLLRYVSRNPGMLTMLEELVMNTSTMQSSIGKKIFNKN